MVVPVLEKISYHPWEEVVVYLEHPRAMGECAFPEKFAAIIWFVYLHNKKPPAQLFPGGWDFSFVVRGSFLSILVKSYYHCSKGKYERYESQDAISRYRMY